MVYSSEFDNLLMDYFIKRHLLAIHFVQLFDYLLAIDYES
jgi:hypothetical protein